MSALRSGAVGGPPPFAGLDVLVHRAVQLVWLNLWWVLLTLRGGVVAGIGPATVGAHAVASAWARGDQEVDVPRTMRDAWTSRRRPAGAVGMLALALVASLALTWWMSRGVAPIPAAITQGIVLLTVLLLVATLPYLPWVIDRSDVADGISETSATPRRASHLFATALAIGLSRPVLTLALGAIWILWPLLLLTTGWPGLLPVVGVSVPITASAWCLHRALPAPGHAGDSPDSHSSPSADRRPAAHPSHDLERKP